MPRISSPCVKSVVLFCNETKPDARRMLRKIEALLRRSGVRVQLCRDRFVANSSVDLAIALGGDGTMLRAARVLAPHSIPLLGINYGHLGYLSGTDFSGFLKNWKAIQRGKFFIEERWMISVELRRGSKRIYGPCLALNDCVIRCGEEARAILLKARSGERFVADYFGDGLIIATPTGSTAYALAASGPIVDPGLDVLLIAPICPHTLTQRPLVVSAEAPFAVSLSVRHEGEVPCVVLSLDGQIGCPMRVGDEVRLSRYEEPFHLVVDPRYSYFDVLRQKLRWGSS